MNDSKPYTPKEIDTTEDRMGSIEQLDFDQHQDDRKGRIGDEVPAEELEDEFPPERVAEAGMTTGEVPGGQTGASYRCRCRPGRGRSGPRRPAGRQAVGRPGRG